jgi:hypothetical protein
MYDFDFNDKFCLFCLNFQKKQFLIFAKTNFANFMKFPSLALYQSKKTANKCKEDITLSTNNIFMEGEVLLSFI